MNRTQVFTLIYFAAILAEILIRAPYRRQTQKNKLTDDRFDASEAFYLTLLLIGIFLAPLVYAVTPWLNFANYSLPRPVGWIGVGLIAAALWVFRRAHVDLGRNWSPTLQIREQHSLVTEGIYRHIRHPMYASQWLWSIAQMLLLQNWIAGPIGLILFTPFYLWRVRQEEQMMLDHFGDEYRRYMEQTGRVAPRLV